MTADKIREVVRIYRQVFGDLDVHPHKYTHDGKPLPKDVLSHCYTMLDQIDSFAIEGRTDKAFRWLGFVQGSLWVCGVFTIEELKNHNRP